MSIDKDPTPLPDKMVPRKKWPPFLAQEIRNAVKLFTQGFSTPGANFRAYLVAKMPECPTILAPVQHLMHENKDMVEQLGISFIHGGATELCLVSESWAILAHGDEAMREVDAYRKKHGGLEGHQLVKERLMVTHFSVSGDYSAFATILKGRKLGEWECYKAKTSGRFANLFLKAQARSAKKRAN